MQFPCPASWLLCLLPFFHSFNAHHRLYCLFSIDTLQCVVAHDIELVEIFVVLAFHVFLVIDNNLQVLVLVGGFGEIGSVLFTTRRLEGRFHLHDFVPFDTGEEGVVLDLFDILGTETLFGV